MKEIRDHVAETLVSDNMGQHGNEDDKESFCIQCDLVEPCKKFLTVLNVTEQPIRFMTIAFFSL